MAEFKAKILNNFVCENNINHVIEFGCGDGNQLKLSKYPKYTGFDVSETAIKNCKELFKNDVTKNFYLLEKYNECFKADLVISLDVIYHLIEDSIFIDYINKLFNTSTKFVIIYSCNYNGETEYHVRPRKFTDYIDVNIRYFDLINIIKNEYPYSENDKHNTSWSDFYVYKNIQQKV